MTRYQVELLSGSHVMGFVLADARSWLRTPGELPFEVIPLQTFANLRNAVNDGSADFFLWEHFTSKRYYDNGSIKRIGEIYTPCMYISEPYLPLLCGPLISRP